MRKSVATFLAALTIGGGALTARAADEAPKTVTDKIPDTTVTFEMVKVPAGQITIKDKDGKDQTVKLKSFYIEKFEARWDEFDVPFFGLDLEKLTPAERDAKHKADLDAILVPS